MNTLKQLSFVLLAILTLGFAMSSCSDDDPIDGDPSNNDSINSQTAADSVVTALFGSWGNESKVTGISTTDPIPSNTNWGTLSPASGFFSNTTYKGATGTSSTPWWDAWTKYDEFLAGTIGNKLYPNNPTDTLEAGATGTRTLDKDTTYIIAGRVYVDNGQTLTIEAGTVLKGMDGDGVDASVLIITKGGMIDAQGTSSDPIIMTSVFDDGSGSANTRGLWGGLIVLGKATLNASTTERSIEGIPSSDVIGLYGGSNDNHSSGDLSYISIRHGGKEIGSGNEINGLTLGAVGSGTNIDHIEVVGNADDGIEWFGGTVNATHLCVFYCGDDALDYDEGFRGNVQWVMIHAEDGEADRGGEHDGGPSDCETCTPYAHPVFHNVTSIGSSNSRAITFRDNAGGEYHNSIFYNYGRGVDFEWIYGQTQHSYKQVVDGELMLENNIFDNIGAGTTAAELFKVVTP